MSGSFVKARLQELPPSLDGPQGQGIATTLGAQQDAEQLLLTHAVLMRFPPRTPDDALDLVGADSNLERYPGEASGTAVPPTGYHGRIVNRWPTWAVAASPDSITSSMNGYGIPDALALAWIDVNSGTPEDTWWSKTYLVLGPNFGSTEIAARLWGDGVWGGPNETYCSTATVDQVEQIKRQVIKWKWAYGLPVSVILLFDDGSGTTPAVTGMSAVGTPTVVGSYPCVWRMCNLAGAPDMAWGSGTWTCGRW